MKSRWLWLSVASSIVFALASFQGCAASTEGQFGSGKGAGNGSGSSVGGAGGECLFCDTGSGGGNPQQGTLVISPASATLDVSSGNLPTEQFTAKLGDDDVTSSVTWVFERPDVGALDSTGTFTPTGKVGGTGKVLALFQDQQAEASVTVNVTLVVDNAGVNPTQEAAFENAGSPDPSLQVLYPFDKTVLPLRVLAPEIQWTGGSAADIYRLRMTSKHVSYTEYFTAPPPSVKTLAQQQWEEIQFSGTGPESDPLKVELSRMSNGVAYQPRTFDLKIAQGIVYGSVYYWQLPDACGGNANGKILRISPSSESTDEFFQPGHCWGCHTVSRDGSAMMATFDVGSSAGFPIVTLDLGANPVTYGGITQATGLTGVFGAFNDDGSKLLISNNYSGNKPPTASNLSIVSTANGQSVLPAAMPTGCGEPAWSPDGTTIAGICNMTGSGWTFDSSNGDLVVSQLNAQQDQVLGSQTIVPKGALPGRPAYPTFSPDSKYIAYGRPTSGSRSTGNGTLWMVEANGQNPIQLTTASNDNKGFNPVFAPKSAGGYTWIVFISRRNYGHKLMNANRQQLWVTAIQDPPVPGVDPSHPPFYLRGQAMCGKSEKAYYALDPCKEDGEECEHGIECCNKSCIYDDGQKKHVCKLPEGGECIPTGSGTCEVDSDCCDFGKGVTCRGGFCELPPPK